MPVAVCGRSLCRLKTLLHAELHPAPWAEEDLYERRTPIANDQAVLIRVFGIVNDLVRAIEGTLMLLAAE